MTTQSLKPLPMAEVYAIVADSFRETGNFTPSHCDVRCACNEILEMFDRDGFQVNFGYSQDAAFRAVRRLLP